LSGIYPLPYVKTGIETQSFPIGLFPVFVKGGWEIPTVRPGSKSSEFDCRTELNGWFNTIFLRNKLNFIPKPYVLILILNNL